MKSTLLLASFVVAALALPNNLEARTAARLSIETYNAVECPSTGLDEAVAFKRYTITDGACMDTPPPEILTLTFPFLSYRAAVIGGAPAGKNCYVTTFGDDNCTGASANVQLTSDNALDCQEVLVGTSGQDPDIGAQSVKFTCVAA